MDNTLNLTGYEFIKKSWEGFMTNTFITIRQNVFIVYKKNKSDEVDPEYFAVRPEKSIWSIMVRQMSNMSIEKINMKYLVITSSYSTTGHILQAKFYTIQFVHLWAYHCAHWLNTILYRVTTSISLI